MSDGGDVGLTIYQYLKGGSLALLVLWTIGANALVLLVLYKSPRLQTTPHLLVGNLAFSDLCLATVVLPLSAIYTVVGEWVFTETLCVVFVSADILCSTASILNLVLVGMDRYWAITSPVAYINRRTTTTAWAMILSVWMLSTLISLAPSLGWRQVCARIRTDEVTELGLSAEHGNYVENNGTWQCVFLDLPSYTIYSSSLSFYIPSLILVFVYFKIYQAFAKHRARQLYRQKVLRKHIESTILHELSHVKCTKDEAEDEEDSSDERDRSTPKEVDEARQGDDASAAAPATQVQPRHSGASKAKRASANGVDSASQKLAANTLLMYGGGSTVVRQSASLPGARRHGQECTDSASGAQRESLIATSSAPFERRSDMKPTCAHIQLKAKVNETTIQRHKHKSEHKLLGRLHTKPRAISAAKERRGVKVLSILVGVFLINYTPFFVMYVVVQFCSCYINRHTESFLTWLGYSNSALNPILYTCFNRDYRIALRRLFVGQPTKTNVNFR